VVTCAVVWIKQCVVSGLHGVWMTLNNLRFNKIFKIQDIHKTNKNCLFRRRKCLIWSDRRYWYLYFILYL